MGIKNPNPMGMGIEIINGDGESKILPKSNPLTFLLLFNTLVDNILCLCCENLLNYIDVISACLLQNTIVLTIFFRISRI